jgi:adenylate cyclase class 2
MADASGHEIEIKLRVSDIAAARRRLRALGARRGPRVHEVNVLFDTPEGSLLSRGMLLRLRVERRVSRAALARRAGGRRELLNSWIFPPRRRQRVIVTLKAPASALAMREAGEKVRGTEQATYRVRREIEFAAADSNAVLDVLAALGFRPYFYYEKIRTTYRLPRSEDLVATLDETPVGVFLELEGRPQAIDRARKALGYQASDPILVSYGALYLEHCRARGVTPRDMVFGE